MQGKISTLVDERKAEKLQSISLQAEIKRLRKAKKLDDIGEVVKPLKQDRKNISARYKRFITEKLNYSKLETLVDIQLEKSSLDREVDAISDENTDLYALGTLLNDNENVTFQTNEIREVVMTKWGELKQAG